MKRFGMMGALLASVAAIGPMTAAERLKGRYMRAPDHGDADFREFEESGDVEVGEHDKSTPAKGEEADAGKPKPRRAAPKPAAPIEETKEGERPADDKGKGEEDAGEDDDDEDGEGDGDGEGEDGEDDKPKPRKKASERIRELNKRLRDSERERIADRARLDALEKGLPANRDASKGPDIGEKPDPTDTAKYPLGHLDERYVEDSMDWRLRKHAAESADASLQRQQQAERDNAARQVQERILGQVDELSAKGADLYDDFQEAVVDRGLKGEWKLEQATFEAAAEADHGPQILYELSQDTKEAERVAKLSPFQQMRFVDKRNAEIEQAAKPRNKPSATPPAKTTTRGGNSRRQIPADTDNLDDFETAWKNDAKG